MKPRKRKRESRSFLSRKNATGTRRRASRSRLPVVATKPNPPSSGSSAAWMSIPHSRIASLCISRWDAHQLHVAFGRLFLAGGVPCSWVVSRAARCSCRKHARLSVCLPAFLPGQIGSAALSLDLWPCLWSWFWAHQCKPFFCICPTSLLPSIHPSFRPSPPPVHCSIVCSLCSSLL